MVGKHLQEILPEATYIGSKDCNLTSWKEVEYMMFLNTPTHVIHLAAKVGGIQDNISKPAEYFDNNVLINTHILRASKQFKVKRFTGILSTCIYPDFGDLPMYPMLEKDMLLGPPAPTNFEYAYAKRCLAVQIEAYNTQYGTKYNYLTPCNLYSEYDNFDNKNKMNFITALLKKIKTSKETLNLLGTGKPLRQFMYAGDFARVIKEVIDKDITDSFNVAPPHNKSINDMAKNTLTYLKKDLKIKYSNPELDGQYRKDVSNEKMLTYLPDFEFTSFEEGVKKVYSKI